MYHVSTEEIFKDGQIVFKDGDSGDWVYVIYSGAVEIFKTVGGESVILEILKPGDIFGEMAYIARIPRTASARAVGETTLGVIDRNFLDKEYNRLSGAFRMILKTLVLRLEKATESAAQSKWHRESPRVPKVLALKFKSQEAFRTAFSEDMSADGIFIKTAKPLPKGERFTLKLHLPETSEPLKIDCQVRWTRTETQDLAKQPPGMGAEFIDITPADQQKLKTELSQVDPHTRQNVQAKSINQGTSGSRHDI